MARPPPTRRFAIALANTTKPKPAIAGYDIDGILGVGGMGTVWRARQHGTGRDVALKLLSDHPADQRAPARFIREVELASQLEHPNVARVYESGVHAGNYYFAMELVDGLALDVYVRRNRLDEAAILRLMWIICDAVQHAHFKGIIHRDLKPSNILVMADGQPRLLDFGLARPITPGRGAAVSDERAGVAGTPAYMSPEQAASRIEQIDTRTDVYSLGKILYELLLGRPAHDLGGTEFDPRCRVVEDEVRRPRQVKPSLSSDLEAVLLKALDRTPGNRYSSAGELGKDLDNLQNNEPVSARPATISYFLGKKLARHRPAVSAVTIFVLALAGLAVYAYVRIARERNIAIDATARASHEAANAKAINAFLQDVLDSLDPKNARGVDKARAIMNRANEALSKTFAGDPASEASVRLALGRNMYALGQFQNAEEQLSTAITLMTAAGRPQLEILVAQGLLAEVYQERGRLAEATKLGKYVLETYQKLLGGHDPKTLGAMNTVSYVLDDSGLRDAAESNARGALRLAGGIEVPADLISEKSTPLTLTLASTLIRLLRDSGEPAKVLEAEDWATRACAAWDRRGPSVDSTGSSLAGSSDIAATDPQALEAIHDLASVFAALGKWDDAIARHRQVIKKATTVLGPDHPDLIVWQNDLAVALAGRGNLAEAEAIYRAILPAATDLRGPENRYTVIILTGLAEVTRRQGSNDADAYYRQVETYAAQALRKWGTNDPQALFFLDAQAKACGFLKKFDDAENAYLRGLEIRNALLGPEHRETLQAALQLTTFYRMTAQPQKARPLLARTATACKHALAGNDPIRVAVENELNNLGPE